MPWRVLSILAAALFLLTVLVRAPARWALGLAPAGIECALPSGSIWQGACARAGVAGSELQDVHWTLHAWPLLRGHLDLDLVSTDVRAAGSAQLSLSMGGHLVLRELRVQMPFGSELLPLFPTAWSGRLRLEFSRVEFEGNRLRALLGVATAFDLAQRNPPLAFGSYELRFDAAAQSGEMIVGSLHDLGGPLTVTGTLQLRQGSNYEVNGLISAGPAASPELAKAIEYLGPADAQGRRPYSLAGTL
jgi:hypothetical protein